MQTPRVRRGRSFAPALFAYALFAVALFATSVHAQSVFVSAAARPIVSHAAAGMRADGVVRSVPRSMSDDLRRVYGDGDWTLLWSHEGSLTAPARAMIAALTRLEQRGLSPRAFGVDSLQAIAAGALGNTERAMAFDTSLTIASLSVLRALRHGQTAGAQLAPRATRMADADVVFEQLLTLTSISTPDVVLDGAEPAAPQYRLLKAALSTYRSQAQTDSFARLHVTQIELTLERWRWMPRGDERTAVVVNIPEFRLYAFHTDSLGVREELTMDVAVGRAGAFETPIFSDSIRYLEFAPYWNVPASLVEHELLPIARRDPYLLQTNNYEIVDRRGRVLPTTAASVRLVERKRAWIRQLPGGTNALGKVKFMFPNEFDIYLHDTPVTRDFLATRRDASHGCIRVSDPAALAQWLLRDQSSQWTTQTIASALNGRAPQRVTLAQPVPVHLIYATAVARADGTVAFFDDIYNLNSALSARMALRRDESIHD